MAGWSKIASDRTRNTGTHDPMLESCLILQKNNATIGDYKRDYEVSSRFNFLLPSVKMTIWMCCSTWALQTAKRLAIAASFRLGIIPELTMRPFSNMAKL